MGKEGDKGRNPLFDLVLIRRSLIALKSIIAGSEGSNMSVSAEQV